MTRGRFLEERLTVLLVAIFCLPVLAQEQISSRISNDLKISTSYEEINADTVIFSNFRNQRTFVPPTAISKRAGHYSITDWGDVIDSTWGPGLLKSQKLSVFDNFWGNVDRRFACFVGIDINWDSLRTLYRDEIVNGDPTYGVSRGRFAAIINHLSLALRESHTFASDTIVNLQTALAPGIPLMAVGWYGFDQGHFGAGLTPMPDSSLLVYRVVPNHPLGLERGDLVLGYDGIPWKQLYHELLAAELPFANIYWGSCEASIEHSFLMAAGLNWHLFDTIDVVKYTTGDTLHLSVAPLIGQHMHLVCTEQMDILGVPMPNTDQDQWVSYGIVEGTQIGYIYGRRWWPEQVGDQFHEAVQDLVENYQTSGLIIDFRTNWGGAAILANDGLSYLLNGNELTADFAQRCNQVDHLALCPIGVSRSCNVSGRAAPAYDKPVAVLTGPGAGSAGDLTAIKFKFLSTARFFGKSTSGEFNAPTTLNSIGNFFMRCSIYNEFLVDEPGQYLTHRELPIDENVWLTRDGVVQGRDDVVEAAIDWINSVQANEPGQSFEPSRVDVILGPGETLDTDLTIQNNGNWPLLYALTPHISNLRLGDPDISGSSITLRASGQPDPPIITGHGGFDSIGQIWMDSDQPHGPDYQWIDITGIGIPITLGDDNYAGPYDLGFAFPFYGQNFSSIYVGSNGILTFGGGSGDYSNDPIPSLQLPNNFIAPLWTDLNCSGRPVYYYRDSANQRFIVSYIGVPLYGPAGSFTFQAVLGSDGEIDFNYSRMAAGLSGGWLNWQYTTLATIGIENASGNGGLQIAYNESYLHDSLSIKIYPSWLALTPASGHVMPGGSEIATVSFRSGDLPPGTYAGEVFLESNDPNEPSITIPVSMEVAGCDYVIGDFNGSGVFNIADIAAAFSFLMTGSPAPAYECECPYGGGVEWAVAMDVNNSCVFNIADVIAAFSRLQIGEPELTPCGDCPPPGWEPGPRGKDRQAATPALESKAASVSGE